MGVVTYFKVLGQSGFFYEIGKALSCELSFTWTGFAEWVTLSVFIYDWGLKMCTIFDRVT